MTHEMLSIYNSEGGGESLGQSEGSIGDDWPIIGRHGGVGGDSLLPSFHELVPATPTGIEISSQHQIIHRLTSWYRGPNIQCKVKSYCFMLLKVYKNYPWLLFSPEIPRNTMLCVCGSYICSICIAVIHRSHNLPTDNVPRWYRVICNNGIHRLTDTRVIDELGTLSSFLLAALQSSYWPRPVCLPVVLHYAWLSGCQR